MKNTTETAQFAMSSVMRKNWLIKGAKIGKIYYTIISMQIKRQ